MGDPRYLILGKDAVAFVNSPKQALGRVKRSATTTCLPKRLFYFFLWLIRMACAIPVIRRSKSACL